MPQRKMSKYQGRESNILYVTGRRYRVRQQVKFWGKIFRLVFTLPKKQVRTVSKLKDVPYICFYRWKLLE